MNQQIQSLPVSIEQICREVNIDKLARESGFCRRKPRKLSNAGLLQGLLCLSSMSGAKASLRRVAFCSGLGADITCSKQSIHKRLNNSTQDFMKRVLSQVIRRQLAHTHRDLLRGFTRVLIADSTTVNLHPRLADVFPGPANGRAKTYSALKLQMIYDLLGESMIEMSLSSFRRNDQAASSDIIKHCRAGDLILRDLGYFSLKVFEQIVQSGADFITRLDPQVLLFDADSGQPLDLLKALQSTGTLDIPVLVGAQKKMPMRLVALPLSPQVANQRRRKAKANRDRRCHPKPRQLKLLGWQIFLTSVDSPRLCSRKIMAAYGLRWRIETLFKAYKTHFKLAELPDTSAPLLIALVYAKLILITGFHQSLAQLIPYEIRHHISTMKFAELFALLMTPRLMPSLHCLLRQIPSHCRYDTRKRPHFLQCAYSLG